MPTLRYMNEPLPEPAEFRRLLREASEHYDPVDELLALERELSALERRHGLTSAEFYAKFLTGDMGDSVEMVSWAGQYEAFIELKTAISESLKLIIAEPALAAR